MGFVHCSSLCCFNTTSPLFSGTEQRHCGLPQQWHHRPVMKLKQLQPRKSSPTQTVRQIKEAGTEIEITHQRGTGAQEPWKTVYERYTKGIWWFNFIVHLTFRGRSGCPIFVRKWFPRMRSFILPWDFSQSTLMSLFLFCATERHFYLRMSLFLVSKEKSVQWKCRNCFAILCWAAVQFDES